MMNKKGFIGTIIWIVLIFIIISASVFFFMFKESIVNSDDKETGTGLFIDKGEEKEDEVIDVRDLHQKELT